MSAETTADTLEEAQSFLELLRTESVIDTSTFIRRLGQITSAVLREGSYSMEPIELEHAGRVAWRQNNRCIGRLPWRTLIVRDCRNRRTPHEIFAACVDHLRLATNDGRIRPVLSVFAADRDGQPTARVLNPQLIRYAGWRSQDGTVVGDPLNLELTAMVEHLGWRPPQKSAFTVLPVAVQVGRSRPELFEVPADAVLEVPIRHPGLDWFAELDLRWHAVPMITSMALHAGGLRYSTAPFNGWYLGTEIGARNLSDAGRYNQLPRIAERLGLDIRSSTSLWRDRALLELNVAVLHSFRAAGVRIVDHHSASDQFITHLQREEGAGRQTPGDWSWIVPPMSSSTTAVFHRYYADAQAGPGFHELPAPCAQSPVSRSPVPDSRVPDSPVSRTAASHCPVAAGRSIVGDR